MILEGSIFTGIVIMVQRRRRKEKNYEKKSLLKQMDKRNPMTHSIDSSNGRILNPPNASPSPPE